MIKIISIGEEKLDETDFSPTVDITFNFNLGVFMDCLVAIGEPEFKKLMGTEMFNILTTINNEHMNGLPMTGLLR